jgi:glycosyltransferase involved in cell wall biosynthesis
LQPSLSVVIPAYNEERRLPPTLERVADYFGRFDKFVEVLIVNDGSRDATAGVARALGEKLSTACLEIRVLENPGNQGKGYSVRHGMLEARGDWALFSDADLSAPIEELPKLLVSAQKGGYDGAIGSRALDRSLVGVHQPAFRELSGRTFNLGVRLLAGLPFHDTQCGFKLFTRAAAQAIFRRQRMTRFGFDVETLYIAKKLGLRIAEIPVRWNDVEGTTVGMLAGADAFLDLARVRWNDMRGLYR